MPYFKNNEINLLFIHIPKTGGTSLENYFKNKYNIELNSNSLHGEKLKPIKVNSSLQHMTYNTIIEILGIDFINNSLQIITIIRNPYDRMISDLFYFNKIRDTSTTSEVFNKIKEYLNSDDMYDNHKLPQSSFITDESNNLINNITILHTETLTNDMINLGYTDFNVIDNNNTNSFSKQNYDKYLNNDSIELINNYYENDFKILNFTKKVPNKSQLELDNYEKIKQNYKQLQIMKDKIQQQQQQQRQQQQQHQMKIQQQQMKIQQQQMKTKHFKINFS